jgi:hypothetical protein
VLREHDFLAEDREKSEKKNLSVKNHTYRSNKNKPEEIVKPKMG